MVTLSSEFKSLDDLVIRGLNVTYRQLEEILNASPHERDSLIRKYSGNWREVMLYVENRATRNMINKRIFGAAAI